MKITRRTTLGEALEEIAVTAESLRQGSMVVNDHKLDLSQEVEFRLELADGGALDLAFDVKWEPAYPAGFIVDLPDGPIIIQEEVWEAEANADRQSPETMAPSAEEYWAEVQATAAAVYSA